mmetsp:Transcript_26022/g.73814  ORF Transcript_26022/g.73814 Transcript_26022/m.73814 type:complete len:263 (-) Transcript_26022:55-843(-)
MWIPSQEKKNNARVSSDVCAALGEEYDAHASENVNRDRCTNFLTFTCGDTRLSNATNDHIKYARWGEATMSGSAMDSLTCAKADAGSPNRIAAQTDLTHRSPSETALHTSQSLNRSIMCAGHSCPSHSESATSPPAASQNELRGRRHTCRSRTAKARPTSRRSCTNRALQSSHVRASTRKNTRSQARPRKRSANTSPSPENMPIWTNPRRLSCTGIPRRAAFRKISRVMIMHVQVPTKNPNTSNARVPPDPLPTLATDTPNE